ncbi:hypothetical protein [Streptomyces gobiensis]|uniref:hypothetical protein n=1 Tax=Streptomyces gobiensis TaxID=2875706 RepID=UPI001E65017C|nr:hypothetical protein [Streptomyces gobiensis]UGY91996.1 hypothetical protein test1122_09865 [Streptomyces gobiensis]
MTRAKKSLAICAIAMGSLAALVTPATASDAHGTSAPRDGSKTVIPADRHQAAVQLSDGHST